MDDSKGLSYFFLGLGIGVAVGVMFAPQSGPETRGQIRDKALEGTDYVRRRGEELKESASGIVDKGKDLLNRQKDQFSSAVDAGKQAYREAVGETREAGAKAADGIGDALRGV
ncbi:MAG: YtxH domain-containing protein [Bryobacteraceae bacterium]|nr:YtxH domain-containing protein [Bryobacteraceae bacterium]